MFGYLITMKHIYLLVIGQFYLVSSSIRTSLMINKLAKIRPVGAEVRSRFMPLTEIPPPNVGHAIHSGRRHLSDDCTQKSGGKEVYEGARIDIIGDYYDEKVGKTYATVIIPDHLDHKHFEITTQVPYFTVGPIEALGYHPTSIKSEHPSECEKIYQDFLDEQYSEESHNYSEESLEMARMPLFLQTFTENPQPSFENFYEDYR